MGFYMIGYRFSVIFGGNSIECSVKFGDVMGWEFVDFDGGLGWGEFN